MFKYIYIDGKVYNVNHIVCFDLEIHPIVNYCTIIEYRDSPLEHIRKDCRIPYHYFKITLSTGEILEVSHSTIYRTRKEWDDRKNDIECVHLKLLQLLQ